MQEKLLFAYEEVAVNTKTLIFNSGIETSIRVQETFHKRGYAIRHLDSTFSDKDRKDILKWFKDTPNAILSSVDRKSTRLNSSHVRISYAVFCLKKKKKTKINTYTYTR